MTLPIAVRASVDKITFMLYPNSSRVFLRQYTEELIAGFCARWDIPRNFFCKKVSGYGYSFILPLSEPLDYRTPSNNDGKPKMFLQICSSDKQRQRIRVEISGYPLTRTDYYYAQKWLLQLTGNDFDCLETDTIKVTRIDVALDLNKRIDELYFKVIRLGKVMMFISKDGKIESITHGPDNRLLKVCFYDLEAKAVTKGKNGARRQKRNGDAKTRAELRVNPNITLNKVLTEFDFKKYFDRIEILDPRFLEVTDMPQILKNHFAAYGYASTLNALEPAQREKLQKSTKNYKYQIVEQGTLVQALQDELRKTKGLYHKIDFSDVTSKNCKTAKKCNKRFAHMLGKSVKRVDNFICS
ncbi:MAG: hypothetical protein KKE30_02270 [Gammaproteobacteria bacterium]|nr:hypothetical protein [Gammaproteobacteria bacterium]MBU1556384.1 hypothetical protein [Gammaproteobacteria bacterium]MBU2068980.1 hypothetical protein [Gammaproteobacteria bacterium]MBU2183203.1 hypothetical protein [Gammaproteobacteria bacterium]MBU2204583.1 hypothetical protein [Gammaproteobacteria bacterium]